MGERFVVKEPSHKERFHRCLFKALWIVINREPGKKLTLHDLELSHVPDDAMITMSDALQNGLKDFEASCGERPE